MSAATDDQERLEKFHWLFRDKGWTLHVEQNDAGWTALFWLSTLGGFAQSATGRTELEAAENAWERYTREPHLGGKAAA